MTPCAHVCVVVQTLCESLLKNYVSTISQVVSLSLKIFLALIRNFRVRPR
jgi:hypothetical protein